MATVEERVAYLEGRGEEHAAAIGEVRGDIRDLRTELRDFSGDVHRRFDHVEAKFDTRFMCLIGFQFATLMAVIAALLNASFR